MALSDNLQGWWCPSLDTAGNGTTTLTDLSGNGNNGTLTNMDAATDWVADTASGGVRYLDFDGQDDCVIIPHSAAFNFTMAFSIAAWIKLPATQPVAFPYILSKYNAGTGDRAWGLLAQFQGGNPALIYQDGGAFSFGNYVQSSTDYSADAWTLLVGTFDKNSAARIYIDGVLRGTDTTSLPTAGTNTQPVIIGKSGDAASQVDGGIDLVATWDRALTAEEITELYNGGRSLNLLASGGSGNIAHTLRSIQQQHESMVTL